MSEPKPWSPRLIESFGVAGLLQDQCKIFYESIFSSQHLGRVSDLLSAKLKQFGADEFRLRSLLLFGFFDAMVAQGEDESVQKLIDPVVIECGLDSEWAAIAFRFGLLNGDFEFNEFKKRFKSKADETSLDALTRQLWTLSDGLVVRWQKSERQMEIAILFRIGKADHIEAPANSEDSKILEFVVLGETPAVAPKAQFYLELGDLNYQELLADQERGLRGLEAGDFEFKVTGEPRTPDLVRRISGVTQKIDDGGRMTIPGQAEELLDPGRKIFEARIQDLESQLKVYQERLTEIENIPEEKGKLDQLRANLTDRFKMVKGGVQNALNKAPLLNRVIAATPIESETVTVIAADSTDESRSKESAEAQLVSTKSESLNEESSEHLEVSPPEKPQKVEDVPPEEVDVGKLMEEIESTESAHRIDLYERELGSLKKGGKNAAERAQRIAEGLMSELVKERGSIQVLARTLTHQSKQKEAELKLKERTLTEDLRRKDESLRQKMMALQNAKDQVSQMSATIEKLRTTAGAAASDAQYKKKYFHLQNVLTSSKEENARLSRAFDDARTQLATTKSISASKDKLEAQMSEMRAKYERSIKLFDEQKRQYKLLAERYEAEKRKSASSAQSAGQTEDLKRKLEQSIAQGVERTREVEKLRGEIERLKRLVPTGGKAA